MSPEQVNGEAVDCRSDVWSLGVVLYVLNEEPDLSTIAGESPDVCSRVKMMLSKALAKDPRERYSSIEEFATDLRDLSQLMGKSKLGTLGARSYLSALTSPGALPSPL